MIVFRYLLLLPVLLLTVAASQAQSNSRVIIPSLTPVKDAILLDSLYRRGRIDQVEALLSAYDVDDSDYKENVYLQPYSEKLVGRVRTFDSGVGVEVQSSRQRAPGIGMLNPTIAIDALARFAVDRFKEELTVAYLTDFRRALDRYPQVSAMLPGTFMTLQQEDFFNYPVLMPALRENAARDLQEFPQNIRLLFRAEKSRIDSINPIAYPLLMTASDLVNCLRLGQPAAEIIEQVTTSDYISTNNQEFAYILRALGVFSDHLHTWVGKPTSTGWADIADMRYLLTHPDAFQFWMALLIKTKSDELRSIPMGAGGNLYAFLNQSSEPRANGVRAMMYQFSQVTNTANRANALRGDSTQTTAFGTAMTDLIASAGETFAPQSRELRNYAQVLRAAGALEQALRTRQYGLALGKTMQLFQFGFVRVTGERPEWLKTMNQYGHFLVSCLSATNSRALQAALENASMPVQSYRVKRKEGAFNISLNMYPGVSLGAEFGRQPSVDGNGASEQRGGLLIAPTVPVGVAVNWGLKKGHSCSIFAPLIDIGAVAAFRFQNEYALLPELNWNNVLAPGLYVQWGLRNSPIALGFGGQLGPALRKVTVGGKEVGARAARVAINLVVDIPMFTF